MMIKKTTLVFLAVVLLSFASAEVYFNEDIYDEISGDLGDTYAIFEYNLTDSQKEELLNLTHTYSLSTNFLGWTKIYYEKEYAVETEETLRLLDNKFSTGMEVIHTILNGSEETILDVDGTIAVDEILTKSQVPNPEKNYRSKMKTFVAEGTLYVKQLHYAFVESILGKGYLKGEKRIAFLEGLNAEINEDLSELEKEHEALWKMACKNIPEITDKPKCEAYL